MTLQSPHAGARAPKHGPSPRAPDTVHDEQELHRAVEAYRFFYPTVSMEGIFNGNREVGVADGTISVLATLPRHVVFTANSDTPYMSVVFDLKRSGPMVIEVPAGPFIGLVDDHNQRWILDIGIPGPDAGNGGKHLLVPPGHVGDLPDGYQIGRSATYRVLLALRALPKRGEGGTQGALDALRRVKVYPLHDPKAVAEFVDVTDRPLDATPLRWEQNLEYWRRLHAILQEEPALEAFRPMYGELAALGIEKGKAFRPDARTERILEEASTMASEEMRVEAFASTRPDRIVWPDRLWEWVGLQPNDANFETDGSIDLEARDRWFFQAIVTSPAMFRRRAGNGSVYFLSTRDASGEYLNGGRTYKLTIPHPVPATLFWSVTAYDARSRSQVKTPQNKAVLGSLSDTLETNSDGSLDLYFGPKAPEGNERNHLRTVPGEDFFLYFRIYGPTNASLDGSWKLGDLERIDDAVDAASGATTEPLAAIRTPDVVESPIGTLHFERGVPTAETAVRIYDELDYLHGVQTYLSSLPAVSMFAMRRAFAEVGVSDNEVLLFPELLDASSRLLTPNCDTVYFVGFLDLSDGPMVLEAPPGVLGVLDDMWSRWVTDFGMAGPDRGEGGRYLILPPGYEGPLPSGGFYVARSRTNHVNILGRAFLENDDPAPAAVRVKGGLRIYAYGPGGFGTGVATFLRGETPFDTPSTPAPTRIVEAHSLELNGVVPNDLSFFELLDAVVQMEPASALDPEIAGQAAAIGIVKDLPFRPDARTRKLLEDAVAMGNAMARTLTFSPREGEGFGYYGGSSRWVNTLFAGGYDFMRPPPEIRNGRVELARERGARSLNARTTMFYVAFGITPAMCMRLTNVGSQYLGSMLDAEGKAFDGAKTYSLSLPPDIPAALFWSVTLYDNETRALLESPQRFPRAGSQSYPTPASTPNEDGSTTLFFGPERPKGVAEGNWIQTTPGRGWFVILRLYRPLAAFFDKSWRPGEVARVEETRERAEAHDASEGETRSSRRSSLHARDVVRMFHRLRSRWEARRERRQ